MNSMTRSSTLNKHLDLRWFTALAIAILVLKVGAVLILLPETPSALAPDEATYADLTSHVSAGLDWRLWAEPWGSTLYPSARAQIVPASLLTTFGLEPITSLRLVSMLYSFIAVLMLIWIVALIYTKPRGAIATKIPLRSTGTLALVIFLLLPSHAVWSTLGLRESANEAFVLLAVAGVCTLLRLRTRFLSSFLLMILVSFALIGAFQSRPLAAATVSIAIGAVIVTNLRLGFTRWAMLLVSLLVGVTLGTLSSGAQAAPPPQATASEASLPSTSESPSVVPLATLGAAITSGVSDLDPSGLLGSASQRREAATVGAESAIKIESCTSTPLHRVVLCEFTRLPGASLRVLLQPLPLSSDWNVLSSSARMAALENTVWLGILALTFGLLVARTSQFHQLTLLVIVFLSIGILGLALFEGNLGTAFRHKSQLLWAFSLLIAAQSGMRRKLLGYRPSEWPDRSPP